MPEPQDPKSIDKPLKPPADFDQTMVEVESDIDVARVPHGVGIDQTMVEIPIDRTMVEVDDDIDVARVPHGAGIDQTMVEIPIDQTMVEAPIEQSMVEVPTDQTLVETQDELEPPVQLSSSGGSASSDFGSSTGMGTDPGMISGSGVSATNSDSGLGSSVGSGSSIGSGSSSGSDSGSNADFDKTIQSDDFEKTLLPDDDDFSKTIQIHDVAADADQRQPMNDDFDKTLAVEEFAAVGAEQKAGNEDFEKTILADDAGSSGSEIDDAKTMMIDPGAGGDDGSKTVVLDEAQGGAPPSQATMTQHQVSQTPAAQPERTRWEGSRTSGMATSAPGSGVGIEREPLAVAARSVSGMSYGEESFGDYRLVKQLGEGGMGVVYVAKQSSLARDVVFKTLKPMAAEQKAKLTSEGRYKSVIDHRTKMFLSEAVVTADLFHPNIVPIYELGESPDGSLFYAMKWVRGRAWNNELTKMTLEENLEALMKVSDAVAFAHARQIVNRDLKPENVMLGEYGEVIVLDWGLALPFGDAEKRLPVALTAGLGSGTPAYMPPELITGPLNKIGPAADIYLLGAMLFEVITGLPPHEFNMPAKSTAREKMAEVRRVVTENVIRPTKHTGELIDIAIKAMATKAEDRYSSVQEFQQALRDFQKHAASRTLETRAREMTSATSATSGESDGLHGYTRYQNSLALFQESLREWQGNTGARSGLTETQHRFAELALKNGDYDLGLSVLDTNAATHAETRTKLLAAKQEREGHARRMKLLKIAAVVLLCMFGLVSAIAARFQFNLKAAVELAQQASEKAEKAEDQAKQADLAFQAANKAKAEAEVKQAEAVENQKLAEKSLAKANEDIQVADKKLMQAGEQLKEADVKLVKANERAVELAQQAKVAEDRVKEADTKLVAANKSLQKAQGDLDVAQERVSDASYRAGLADADRHVREGRYPDARKKLTELKTRFAERCKVEWQLLWDTVQEGQAVSLGKPIESLGMSHDGRVIAAGENDGSIVVWAVDENGLIHEANPTRFPHGARPRSVVVSPSGQLIAIAGDAGAIQIWSMKDGRAIGELKGHMDGVNAVQFSADEKRLVSGADDRTLRIWEIANGRELASVKCLYPVLCLDWSSDSETLVAGTGTSDESNGLAYAWQVSLKPDVAGLAEIRRFQAPPSGKVKQNRAVVAIALSNDGKHAVSNGPGSELHLWRVGRKVAGQTQTATKATEHAVKIGQHSKRVERVRSLAFSADDSRLLAGGDDGTISVWDRRKLGDGVAATLPQFERSQILYGHSGPVRSCKVMPQSPDRVVSASYDQHVWVWNLKTYPQSRKWLDQPADEVAGKQFNNEAVVPALIRHVNWIVKDKPETAKSPVRIVTGHTDSVLSASFRRDGSRVLTSSRDQSARVWNTLTGKPIRADDDSVPFADNVLSEGHEFDVFVTLYFPNGERLLTSSFDGTMRIWDARVEPKNSAGRELAILPETGMFGVVDISRDGQWIVTAGRGNAAQLWKTDDVLQQRRPKPTRILEGQHRFRVTAVTMSHDNRIVLTADREGNVIAWSAETGEVLGRQRSAHTGEVTKAMFLKNSSQLLTAGVDRRAVLWNVTHNATGVALQRKGRFEHDGMVVHLSLSPNEDRFLSVARKGDKKPGPQTKVGADKIEGPESLTRLTLWTIADGSSRLIDLPMRAESAESKSAPQGSVTPSWSADGKQAVVTTADGLVHLLNPENGRFTQTLAVGEVGKNGELFRAVLAIFPPHESPARHLVTQSQNSVTMWQLADGSKLASFRPQGTLFSSSFSADGRVVATGGMSLRMFDADESSPRFGRSLHKIESPHGGIVTSVEFSPAENSQMFLTTSWDSGVKIWEWQPVEQSARQVHILKGHEGPVRLGTWSPDGRRILTVGHDARPRVWTLGNDAAPPTAIELPMDGGSDFDQLCGAFSWDGRFVAVGGRDVSTQESIGWIWRLADVADQPAVRHAIVRGHGLGGINAVAFHPDDDRLLTAGSDGTARLWDCRKNRKPSDGDGVLDAVFLLSLTRPGESTTHRGPVTSLRITPDGKIVTASSDGTAQIWLISRPAQAEVKL